MNDWRSFVPTALLCAPLMAAVACTPAQRSGWAPTSVPSAAIHAPDRDSDGQITRQEWDDHTDLLFNHFDHDGDGYIDDQDLKKSFESIDRDGDGYIEPDESNLLVERHDRNGDHRVSRDEMLESRHSSITLDMDGDGRLSQREFRHHRRKLFESLDPRLEGSISNRRKDVSLMITVFRF